MKQAWALLFGAALGLAQAAEPAQTCSAQTTAAVGAYFKKPHFALSDEEDGLLLAAACKRWPAYPDLEIAVFAYDAGKADQKEQLIAILDQRSGKMVSASVTAVGEDAMMQLNGATLRIDTARYDLAPGVRAFGIDIASGYSAHYCPEAGSGEVRALYVRNGAKIRPVLEELMMSTWSYVDGTFAGCGAEADKAPDPVTDTVAMEIAILKSTSHGYADLELTATSSYDNGAKSKKKPVHVVLHYDGKAYPTGGLYEKLSR